MSDFLGFSLKRTYSLEELAAIRPSLLYPLCRLFAADAHELYHARGISQLRGQIFHLSRYLFHYDRLSPNQQLVLQICCDNAGKLLLLDALQEKLGNRLSPQEVEMAAMTLSRTGWLVTAGKPPLFLALPEIAAPLPHLAGFRQYIRTKAPADLPALKQDVHWLRDLIRLAAFLYLEQPKLTAKNLLNKQSLKKLWRLLSVEASTGWEEYLGGGSYPPLFASLLRLLASLDCLEEHPRDGALFLGLAQDNWQKFTRLSPARRLLIATLSLLFVPGRYDDNPLACGEFLGAWQNQYQTGWVSLQQLEELSEAGARSNGGTESTLAQAWALGLVEKGSLEMPASWVTEGKALRFFWRLTPAGQALALFCRQHPPGKSRRAVAQWLGAPLPVLEGNLSPAALKLESAWNGLVPPDLDGELMLQPDLSLLLPLNSPPYLVWLLDICAGLETNDYLYQSRFSQSRLLESLKAGLTIAELLAALERSSKFPPPPSVLVTLRTWSEGFDRALLAQALLLACKTPDIAAEIRVQPKLQPYILGAAGPAVLIITANGAAPIRKWLEKRGWTPRPGIAPAEFAASWLEETKNGPVS